VQIPRILQVLELFGIPVIGKPGLEADDVIATLTDRVLEDPAHPDLTVRIVSKDKDLEQLLRERVTLFDIHTGDEMDHEALYRRRGVTPDQVIDYLTLTGDVVDNVPGVPGIGPKTAAKLLHQFGSVDGILENLDQVKGQCRENLLNARAALPISRRLVTLHRDPEISFDLEAARVRPLPKQDMAELCRTLGFGRLTELFGNL
jgi:DNA polymerase-1